MEKFDTENTENFGIFSDYDGESESNDNEKSPWKKSLFDQTNDYANNVEICGKPLKEEERSLAKEESNNHSQESIEVWSIEDDTLFFPTGISNYSIHGVNKFVVLTWSDFFVINFVIQKNSDSKQTKTTRARLNIPDGEEIKDVQILEFNTLLLLKSGSVNFFSSLKSMHKLTWLEGVYCFSAASNGFSCIRLMHDQTLVLEVYDDVMNMGRMGTAPLRHQYNITFDDRNLFNCRWEDEHFVLLTTSINEENVNFLEHLTRHISDLKAKEEIHLFAISGNIFALIADPKNEQDYAIEMIFSYASNIAFIKIDSLRKICVVFLQCGSIDIWFMSEKTQSLRHQLYYSGSEYVSYTYSDASCSFYFSDCSQIGQINFDYVLESDAIDIVEVYKSIPGIYAISWVETIQCLVCLDCNNIFHQITFDPVVRRTTKKEKTDCRETEMKLTTAADYEKFNTLFELTPSRVLDLAQKAHVIVELRNMPQELYRSIDNEFVKQQMLAVADKRRFYSEIFTGCLEFSRTLPEATLTNTRVLYLETRSVFGSCKFFALISLDLFGNEIFQNAAWQLQLHYNAKSFSIAVPSSFLKEHIDLVIPIEISNTVLLSSFQMDLYTSVAVGSNFVPIQIPINLITNSNTYAKLFGPYCSQSENKFLSCNLNKFLDRYKRPKKSDRSTEIVHSLFIPTNLNLSMILKMLPLPKNLATNAKTFEINFLNSKVCGNFDNENILLLKSQDAAALFYLKLYLRYFLKEEHTSKNSQEDIDYQQIILRYQCTIESLYGTLNKTADELYSDTGLCFDKLETLKQLYNKMRKELVEYIFL